MEAPSLYLLTQPELAGCRDGVGKELVATGGDILFISNRSVNMLLCSGVPRRLSNTMFTELQ